MQKIYYLMFISIFISGQLNLASCSSGEEDLCGNNICDSEETFQNCPQDCEESGCGNNVIDNDEQCDGTNLNEKECIDFGFTGGTLSCNNDCTFDKTACEGTEENCGNSEIDENEDCDGEKLNSKTCELLGFTGGDLSCNDDCSFDKTQCEGCGNGNIENDEECDVENFNNRNCMDFGFFGGDLKCSDDCKIITDDCSQSQVCPNNILELGEECDGDTRGATCENFGFLGGTLKCGDNCLFDVSDCTAPDCGNNTHEGYEHCDGTDLGDVSCTDLGFSGGELGCSDCFFDTQNCTMEQLGAVGDPCRFDDQCESGICFEEVRNGMPLGYCVDVCDDSFNCNDPDATCVDLYSLCFLACDLETGEGCRENYTCYDVGDGQGICTPACTENDQCPISGYCNENGGCDCPPGFYYDEELDSCVSNTCEQVQCDDINMNCNPFGGCEGYCAACDYCLTPDYIRSTNHCYPEDAHWGGPCSKHADCPGTGIPGEDTRCNTVTGGNCVQLNGPDFVEQGQPCNGDPESVGIQITNSVGVYKICSKPCVDDTSCRPGYYCQTGLSDSGTVNACVAITDCDEYGCNDENSEVQYYCDLYADEGERNCWINKCVDNPCASDENSNGTCSNEKEDYVCECNDGFIWNRETRRCESFSCGAIDLGTYTERIELTNQNSCTNGTQLYDPARNTEGSCTGYSATGAELVYKIALPGNFEVVVEMIPNNFDSSLYIITQCIDVDAESCVVGADVQESVVLKNSSNLEKTFYIVADTGVVYNDDPDCGVFTLRIYGEECGNGIRELTELCDDGNDNSEDGCADCSVSPDSEPNNDYLNAINITTLPGIKYGQISPAGDQDWYMFTVNASGDWIIETDGTAVEYGGIDTQIWLCDDSDPANCTYEENNIDSDDDLAPNVIYSQIVHTFTEPGTYYVGVRGYNESLTGSYGLRIYQ